MRVLKTAGSEDEGWIPQIVTHHGQPYAILSHVWLKDNDQEVQFADVQASLYVNNQTQHNGSSWRSKKGFAKLRGAAQQALKDGYGFIWVDTCCIDKSSSAELSEAINSMWTWYSLSSVCYVYLADVPLVPSKENLAIDRSFTTSDWWKRGWTLQELLAPQDLKFFTSSWQLIGLKKSMDIAISSIAHIDPNVINGTLPPETISIAQRMSWASTRTTTRREDIAYCLMGIFNVNMPLLYGEGIKAFQRLQQEIMKDSDDESIFAWRDDSMSPDMYSGLLARHPRAFLHSDKVVCYQDTEHRKPYSMTNKGLSLSLRMSETRERLYIGTLHCANPNLTNETVCIYLLKVSEQSAHFARVKCSEWAHIPKNASGNIKDVFVKQSFTQPWLYNPLEPRKRKIRLLQLIATEGIRSIRMRLIEANVKIAKYTALSYRWSSAEDRETILVNAIEHQVVKPCFDFLKSAQQALKTDLFWIDSICIDQTNTNEKHDQIMIMKEIHDNASEVVVWLGHRSSDGHGHGLRTSDESGAHQELVWTERPILQSIQDLNDV